MPNGHKNKEYGPHEYPNHGGTSDCTYGCGCWMGPFRSGGPTGVDPFGACPKNPKDGILLGGDGDIRAVVEQRIQDLEHRCVIAERQVEQFSPGKEELVATVEAQQQKLYLVLQELQQMEKSLARVRQALNPPVD